VTIAIGVLAEVPLPEKCKTRLLAAHPAEWIAGLYAAMLRDTLDGLLSIDNVSDHIVCRPADVSDEEANALGRHVHAPWTIATDAVSVMNAERVVLARADAPAAAIEPLLHALATPTPPRVIVGASTRGLVWLVAMIGVKESRGAILRELPWDHPEALAMIRVRCTRSSVPLEELPTAIVVDEPSEVFDLINELRRHPDRAPRTAQFVVTRA